MMFLRESQETDAGDLEQDRVELQQSGEVLRSRPASKKKRKKWSGEACGEPQQSDEACGEPQRSGDARGKRQVTSEAREQTASGSVIEEQPASGVCRHPRNVIIVNSQIQISVFAFRFLSILIPFIICFGFRRTTATLLECY